MPSAILPSRPRMRSVLTGGGRTGTALRVGASVAVAVALLQVTLPRAVGTTWAVIRDTLLSLSGLEILSLGVIWFLGLWAHTFVLTGALPGLSHRRALTLNLTGSAVSNLVPFGGALGIGVNYAMLRSWRFLPRSFTVYTLVTNLWDVLAKLALPIVALTTLVLAGGLTSRPLETAAVCAAALLGLLLAAMAVVLVSERGARRVARVAGVTVRAAMRLVGSSRRPALETAVLELRASVSDVIRRQWARLTLGMASYVGLQALLLWLSLHVVGSRLGIPQVLAGFALERVLSLVLVTPGGVGIAETGTAALLLALGGDPVSVAAGVLIYRGFIFLLEIPVGGVGLALWFGRRRWVSA